MPETAGVSLEEIDGLFRNKVAEEDEARRAEVCHIVTSVQIINFLILFYDEPRSKTSYGWRRWSRR